MLYINLNIKDEEDAMRPQLRIIGDLYQPKKKEEHSNSLPIKNFQKYRCFDYSLGNC